jgi:hypothetical protein
MRAPESFGWLSTDCVHETAWTEEKVTNFDESLEGAGARVATVCVDREKALSLPVTG